MGCRVFGISIAVCLSIFAARASQLPLTAKDVGLMVRMGYSSGVMAQELSTRHFVDTLDSTKEADLIKAGVTPELLTALKNGTYSVPPEEIARAREQIAAEAKRRVLEAEQSRKFNTLYQYQLAKERSVAQVLAASANGIYNFVKGDLVRPLNGSLVHADDEALSHKKLIAFYFSANWNESSRKFTPELVEYYNRVKDQHPEFEIIFFSLDKSESDMEAYMRQTNMPWPAIDYQKLQEKEVLKKSAGDGIPSLVLVDQAGKLLSSTSAGSQYFGPAKVLADLDSIFSGNAPAKVAQTK
jgi:nucleoredoxin